MIVPLTVLCIAEAFIGWNYLDIGSLGVLFSLGNGVVGAWGFWTVCIDLFNSISLFRTVDHDSIDALRRFGFNLTQDRGGQADIRISIQQ